jgi:hypothetical protein
MRHDRIPHTLIIFIIFLVIVTFLAGTLRAFANVHAFTVPVAALAVNDQKVVDITPALMPTPTVAETMVSPAPTQRPVSAPVPPSADTGGIISLAVVIAFTVLIGVAWGIRTPSEKRVPPKKN